MGGGFGTCLKLADCSQSRKCQTSAEISDMRFPPTPVHALCFSPKQKIIPKKMHYLGKNNEYLKLAQISTAEASLPMERVENSLMMLWCTEGETRLNIDGMDYRLAPNELVCLTDLHRTEVLHADQLRLVRFNRAFYCILEHDTELGCKGILFFGASKVPVISIPEDEREKFDLFWKTFSVEMQSRDNLQFDMLQMMLKRLIILCTRLYKTQQQVVALEKSHLDIIREFNFLVEVHYKTKHTVADYAEMLNKSPKTLSNYFALYNSKTPLQIIQERIMLEARRLLRYTDIPVTELGYSIGFEDVQAFSRFFKAKEGMSPTEYRG